MPVGARGAPLLVRRTPLLTLGVVFLFLLAAPRSRRRRSFRARGKKRRTTFVLFDLRIVPPRFSGVRTPGFWGTYPAFPGYGATCGAFMLPMVVERLRMTSALWR